MVSSISERFSERAGNAEKSKPMTSRESGHERFTPFQKIIWNLCFLDWFCPSSWLLLIRRLSQPPCQRSWEICMHLIICTRGLGLRIWWLLQHWYLCVKFWVAFYLVDCPNTSVLKDTCYKTWVYSLWQRHIWWVRTNKTWYADKILGVDWVMW